MRGENPSNGGPLIINPIICTLYSGFPMTHALSSSIFWDGMIGRTTRVQKSCIKLEPRVIEPEHVDLCSLDGFFFALKVWWLQSQGLDDRPWTVAAKLLERGAKGKLVRPSWHLGR